MGRKLFTLAAGVSGVLCVAACALNAWSSRMNEVTDREDQARFNAVGDLQSATWQLLVDAQARQRAYLNIHPHPNEAERRQIDADEAEVDRLTAEKNRADALPWPPPRPLRGMVPTRPVVLAGVLPAVWLADWELLRQRRAKRRARRRANGQCVVCGYDLRATPDRCPECGAVAERAGSAGPRGC